MISLGKFRGPIGSEISETQDHRWPIRSEISETHGYWILIGDPKKHRIFAGYLFFFFFFDKVHHFYFTLMETTRLRAWKD